MRRRHSLSMVLAWVALLWLGRPAWVDAARPGETVPPGGTAPLPALRYSVSDGLNGAGVATGGTITYRLGAENAGAAPTGKLRFVAVTPYYALFDPTSSTPGWACVNYPVCWYERPPLQPSEQEEVQFTVAVERSIAGCDIDIELTTTLTDLDHGRSYRRDIRTPVTDICRSRRLYFPLIVR